MSLSPSTRFPIIDSHVHLYAASHISQLNWTADLPQQHPLYQQNSVAEYRKATSSSSNLRGFIFLETDRKSGLKEDEWNDALDEVSFLARIADGRPLEDEGHEVADQALVLGIVPWAPVPAGPEQLSHYMDEVYKRCGSISCSNRIKGVRYLVQDKPSGTMYAPEFIKSLQWLGTKGLTFDLGVDARSGGVHQLIEACHMLERVYQGGSEVRVIINHLCKPNLRLGAAEAEGRHPDFDQWSISIAKMASYRNTWMKFSGLFSELQPQEEGNPANIAELVILTKPWIDVVFQFYGPSRILFGSDWPVCNVNGPGTHCSWIHWVNFVTAALLAQKLTEEEQAMVWSGNSINAYKLDP